MRIHHSHLGAGLQGTHISPSREHESSYANQYGRDNPPQEYLCQSDKTDTDNFPHHQIERPHRRNHHLDDAVGLFLHHPLHDHRTIHHNEHINNEREYHSDHGCYGGRRRTFLPVFAPFDGLYIKINFTFPDDLFQIGDVEGSKLLTFELFA